MAASQVSPSVPSVAPTAAPHGTFPAAGASDQDWNIGVATATTRDWAEDAGGDWGSTEPKVYFGSVLWISSI